MSAPPPRPARPNSGKIAPIRPGRFGVAKEPRKPAPQVTGAPPVPRGKSRGGSGCRPSPTSRNKTFNGQPSRPPRNAQPPVPAPRGPQRATRANAANRQNNSISIIMDDEPTGSTIEEPNASLNTPTKSLIQREATLARSIICLDQTAFLAQIKAEENLDRKMSMVRNQMPLPSIPGGPVVQSLPVTPSTGPNIPSTKPPIPSPRSPSNLKPLKLKSSKTQEALENFIKQEKEYVANIDSVIAAVLQPVRQRKILSSFEIVSLFSSVETVFETSLSITESMENILTTSHPANIEDAEILAKFAEIFTTRADRFQDYINYVSNLPSIPGRITTYKSDHEEFDNIVKTWERATEKSLKDILHTPKHRMAAYSSFLCYLLEQVPGGDTIDSLCITYWGNGSLPKMQTWPRSSTVRQISCGNSFIAALTDDMHVWTWGHSTNGALGQGNNKLSVSSPEKLSSISNVSIISCGSDTLAMVSLDGTLSISGLLPNGKQTFEPSSYSWDFTGKISLIEFAGNFCIIVTEDKWTEVWAWGSATAGQLGLGPSIDNAPIPRTIEALGGLQISKISISEKNAMALTSESKIYVWGSNSSKATGTGSSDPFISVPTLYNGLEGQEVTTITCGDEFFYAAVESGNFYCWGKSGDGMLGKSFFAEAIPSLKSIGVLDIQSGGNYCVALTQSGKTVSWGNGAYYQTGHQNTTSLSAPTEIKSLQSAEVIQLCTAPQAAAVLHSQGNSNNFASRICSAKVLMEENVAVMEEQIRQVENISKLLEIDLSLTNGSDYNIVVPTRTFIMKSPMKVGGMDGQSFMFDDSILLCRKKGGKRFEIYQMINFDSCVLGKQTETGNKFGFEIRAHKANKFISLDFNHSNERDLWQTRVEQQMKQCGAPPPDTNMERPPSYFPPVAPGTAATKPASLQKTISLSHMNRNLQLSNLNQSVGEVQANIKAKTKNFRIPRFSNRTFQKLEKKMVSFTEGPMLTTEGASMPADEQFSHPRRQIGSVAPGRERLQNSAPSIAAEIALTQKLPQIPVKSGQGVPPPMPEKPVLPAKPEKSTTFLPDLPAVPPSPRGLHPKPSDVEILTELRSLLGVSSNSDIIKQVRELISKNN